MYSDGKAEFSELLLQHFIIVINIKNYCDV